MADYTVSIAGGGGGGPPAERKIIHLGLKNNQISNVGDVFPPQQFFWDTLRHYPDPSVMEYNKFTGRIELKEEGTYLVEATVVVSIENDTNPVSTLTWYIVDNFAAPSKILLSVSSRNSGLDKTLTHTGRTLVKVLKGSTGTLDFAFAVDDPIPVETITIVGQTFTGADEFLTNVTVEKISDTTLPDVAV